MDNQVASAQYDAAISEWVDELLLEIEVSLAKHAEFARLYPEPVADRPGL